MTLRTLAAISIFLLTLGCASTPIDYSAKDNFIDSKIAPPKPGELVVLLPSSGEDRALAQGERILQEQLARALQRLGYKVSVLSLENYKIIWRQEVEAVGGIYESTSGEFRSGAHARALSQLATRICAETGCALVMRHRLVTRTAEMQGIMARWDGQERRVPLASTGGGSWSFSGQTPGLSVELLSVTRSGEIAFRTYGGALLPFSADVTRSKSILREDLFAYPQEISEAVEIALLPFFRLAK